MRMKGKFLQLWLFLMVIVSIMVMHIAGHLRFVLEHCLASVLPMLRG